MKIDVDKGACIGAGNCVEVAPRLFSQEGGSGVVVPLVPEAAEADRADAELAAEVCPVAAILIGGN